MISCIQLRVRAVRWIALAAIVSSFACSGSGGGSAPFEIVSPSSRAVTVPPGQSVRFEIRANGGRLVEYVIDDVRTEPGPVFLLQPTAQHHVVQALIRSAQPSATPDVVLFTVDVVAPGNLAPQITSFTVEPASGEAEATEFTARVNATDADGTVDSVSVDFGEGTELARGTSFPFTATHTYAAEGTLTVTARVVDDAGVPATSTRQIQVAPHNNPPNGSLHSERTNGDPPQGTDPLTVRLESQGSDADGTIATWELDKGLGAGFELIGPAEPVTVTYPFREEPYMPRLRLTDDLGEAAVIEVDQDIVVLRDVSSSNSSYTVRGNSRFDNTGIAPAIWANGSDPLAFTIRIQNSQGLPVSGVRVRVATDRPDRVAPDGTQLGTTVSVVPGPVLTADAGGTVSGSIVTDTSTRVEAMPMIDFEPFHLTFEVELGRDVWAPLDLDAIGINANSTVSGSDGRVNTIPDLVCPGQPLQIMVEAEGQSGAPGGAAHKYTELLYTNEQPLSGYRPASGYANWRTDGSGTIRFNYTPVRADQGKLFLAWVDGQPLGIAGALFLKPPDQCGGN